MRTLFMLLFAAAFSVQPAFATPLKDKQIETSFDVLFERDDDLTSYAAGVALLFNLPEGYLQPGIEVQYFRLDFDEDFIDDTITDYSFAPRVDFNFTPGSPVTGYATLSLIFFGGDVADFYENGYGAGIGLKAFVGNAASVNVLLEYEKWKGESDSFFTIDDRNVAHISAGASLYFGDK